MMFFFFGRGKDLLRIDAVDGSTKAQNLGNTGIYWDIYIYKQKYIYIYNYIYINDLSTGAGLLFYQS